jgi:hypothetical protein
MPPCRPCPWDRSEPCGRPSRTPRRPDPLQVVEDIDGLIDHACVKVIIPLHPGGSSGFSFMGGAGGQANGAGDSFSFVSDVMKSSR